MDSPRAVLLFKNRHWEKSGLNGELRDRMEQMWWHSLPAAIKRMSMKSGSVQGTFTCLSGAQGIQRVSYPGDSPAV